MGQLSGNTLAFGFAGGGVGKVHAELGQAGGATDGASPSAGLTQVGRVCYGVTQ